MLFLGSSPSKRNDWNTSLPRLQPITLSSSTSPHPSEAGQNIACTTGFSSEKRAILSGELELFPLKAAGYRILGQRRLSGLVWENDYRPAQIAQLRPGADDRLAKVLDENEAEIATWRAHQQETGYLLSVARPRFCSMGGCGSRVLPTGLAVPRPALPSTVTQSQIEADLDQGGTSSTAT